MREGIIGRVVGVAPQGAEVDGLQGFGGWTSEGIEGGYSLFVVMIVQLIKFARGVTKSGSAISPQRPNSQSFKSERIRAMFSAER